MHSAEVTPAVPITIHAYNIVPGVPEYTAEHGAYVAAMAGDKDPHSTGLSSSQALHSVTGCHAIVRQQPRTNQVLHVSVVVFAELDVNWPRRGFTLADMDLA